ncbi:putative reverse transcriptase domain-containing protein [Tanacetum coccineum]|uniref:Reverse transcriptase domain-containing protein n=1 Tax=Tanacetum coccineum TaxID=301880 RepID=A0ABQ4WTY7_9ASTR
MLSCYAFFPILSLEPLKDGWTDFLQEPLIPGISLKKPLSKGIARPPKPISSLKKSAISSRKWEDGSSSRNIDSSSNSEGIAAVVNKLDSLGRDMKKLKENVHAIQVGCASVNVIPKSKFEHLKLARFKKTDMLVEMAYTTKRTPIGIIENILVKIDKLLFLSDFVVINMLNTRNKTMILGRPFLVTIHAEIDVFIKEISLGIGDDRVTFDMDKKIHNFMTPIGKIYMINSIHNDESPSRGNALSDKSSRMNEEGFLKLWYCYLDGDRESIKGNGLSFPEFLLVKYGEAHKKELFWDNRFSQQGIGIQGLLDSLSCVIPGDTRLLNRSFVRIHLLQLSFKVESNA